LRTTAPAALLPEVSEAVQAALEAPLAEVSEAVQAALEAPLPEVTEAEEVHPPRI
jgi:hypothetical protein